MAMDGMSLSLSTGAFLPLKLPHLVLFLFVQKRRMMLTLKLIRQLRIFVSIKLHVCQQGRRYIFFALSTPVSAFLCQFSTRQSLSTSIFIFKNPTEYTKLK